MQQKNQKKFGFRSQCPVSSALDIVGDKWSLLVIRDLVFQGKKTFSEFAQSEERIASNILTDRLSRMEQMGILERGGDKTNKKTVIYTLTEKGVDLLPILVEYILWSDKYLHHHISAQARQMAAMLKKQKAAIIKEMREKLLG